MDSLLDRTDIATTVESLRDRVVSDAKRTFVDVTDEGFLVRCAHDAVDELMDESIKVTTFIPILAMRRVRDVIESRLSGGMGTGATA